MSTSIVAESGASPVPSRSPYSPRVTIRVGFLIGANESRRSIGGDFRSVQTAIGDSRIAGDFAAVLHSACLLI